MRTQRQNVEYLPIPGGHIPFTRETRRTPVTRRGELVGEIVQNFRVFNADDFFAEATRLDNDFVAAKGHEFDKYLS